MDPTSITQQLAKQADTGTAAIILLLLVLFVLCWPRIVDGIERLRGKKTVSVDGDVRTVGPFVTCGECKQHREAIGKRIDSIESSTRKIIDKLDVIDTRAEKRSVDLHRRLDPIIEKVATDSAKIDVFETIVRDALKSSTVGGRK